MADTKPCTFCTLPPERIIDSNEYGVVIRDAYPITQGHTLVIPKRHMASWFEATQAEQLALFSLLNTAKELLTQAFKPDSFNIGINDGPAAGQTIPHLHMHLIPRYKTDHTDPRGGVRWIIPDKAKYWT
jgi:diadenosine tetraphosphate (Ap4A) HIT family hydrolase